MEKRHNNPKRGRVVNPFTEEVKKKTLELEDGGALFIDKKTRNSRHYSCSLSGKLKRRGSSTRVFET